jgi:plastocyanin
MYPGKPLFTLMALAVLVTALAGCTSPTPTPFPAASVTPTEAPTGNVSSSPVPSLPQSAAVTIKDLAFNPDVVRIAVGGSVTWTNQDGTAHTVKFSDTESSSLGNGAAYTKKFDAPGKYDYNCGIHPSMKGAVEVT